MISSPQSAAHCLRAYFTCNASAFSRYKRSPAADVECVLPGFAGGAATPDAASAAFAGQGEKYGMAGGGSGGDCTGDQDVWWFGSTMAAK